MELYFLFELLKVHWMTSDSLQKSVGLTHFHCCSYCCPKPMVNSWVGMEVELDAHLKKDENFVSFLILVKKSVGSTL